MKRITISPIRRKSKLDNSDPAAELGRILKERGHNLAVAETTTGGMLSALIVSVPGSSAYFDRGIVAYSKASKVESLRIEAGDLDRFGAVSRETAGLLAESVRTVSRTTFGLAETGIAGPIQGRSPKPIGTAFVAMAGPEGTEVKDLLVPGDRAAIQKGIAKEAILFAIEQLR